MSENDDIYYMQKALVLAAKGVYTTSPNPNVGCVIVNNNRIVGEGYHRKAGGSHAEVCALSVAKGKAAGATAYVTLEPCCHIGRTSPCVDELIQAGITKVVIAVSDPNPLVAGKGIKKLKMAGITVITGVLAKQAKALNAGFLKRMRCDLPYIQLKMASSLDGKTAMASGESKWITSALSRQDVQQFRAKNCAILSTSATVLADNPQLTVRWQDLPKTVQQHYPRSTLRVPVRIILDSQNKLTFNERIFQQLGEIWLVVKKNYNSKQLPENVTLLIDDSESKHIDLSWLFKMLAKKMINAIWVEAGAHLAGALIKAKLIDELILYIAPRLLGSKATDLCVLPHLTQLANAPSFKLIDVKLLDNDLRLVLSPE